MQFSNFSSEIIDVARSLSRSRVVVFGGAYVCAGARKCAAARTKQTKEEVLRFSRRKTTALQNNEIIATYLQEM